MLPSSTLLPAALGLLTGLSLIVAIGAQNAYVLRLGIDGRGRMIGVVVSICAVSDAVLIIAGALGIGALIEAVPVALVVIRVVGSGFLIVYGLLAARRALRPAPATLEPAALEPAVATAPPAVAPPAVATAPAAVAPPTSGTPDALATPEPATLEPAVATAPPARGRASIPAAALTALALTWLNPHVYLDTVIFLGSVANQQGPAERWWWVGGAILASFLWFFALGFGARLLRPLFARPRAWQVLDAAIALVMLTLGLRLALGA